MNIYELTIEYQRLQEALENGEEVDELLEAVSGDIEAKADGYARIIRNFESDIEGLRKAEADLKDKRERLENTIKRMKANLQNAMTMTGKTKFKTDLFSFNIAKNGGKPPLILNSGIPMEDYPEEVLVTKTYVNNDLLRQYIEETGDITYGYIGERGESLRIR